VPTITTTRYPQFTPPPSVPTMPRPGQGTEE